MHHHVGLEFCKDSLVVLCLGAVELGVGESEVVAARRASACGKKHMAVLPEKEQRLTKQTVGSGNQDAF
jgi:hypothetical protein